MMRASILSLLLLLLSIYCDSQAVVPQSSPLTTCQDKQFIVFGNDDVQAMPIKTATTSAPANYIHTTHFNVTQRGVTISQLSFGLLDNPSIATMTLLRLALYSVNGFTMTLLAQSDEIQLFATTATTIYANIAPTHLQQGSYAIGFWANAIVYTGVGVVPTPSQYTTAYLAYSYNGLARSSPLQYTYGSRALAARGCVDTQDPFTDPNNQLYAMCAYIEARKPSATTSWSYTNTHYTYVISGKLAVSRTNTGTSGLGRWNKIVGGFATMQIATSGGYYYSPEVIQSSKIISLGGPIETDNNRLYSGQTYLLDGNGISFMTAANDEQVILNYPNILAYGVTILSAGSRDFFGGSGAITGFSVVAVDSIDAAVACSVPSTFRSDALSCPAGQTVVSFGDDSVAGNVGTYSAPLSDYNYANIIHHRPFKVNVKNVEMRQVSIMMNDNLLKVVRMRMALYSYTGAYQTMPSFTLLSQTRQVSLDNIRQQVVTVDLETPVNLNYGQNYTLAFITDIATYSPYGYFAAWPVSYTVGYDALLPFTVWPLSLPRSPATSELLYTVPLGGYGCAREAQPRQFAICSSFVYAGYTRTYNGLLTAISQPYESETGGQYYQVTGGSGTMSYITTTATTIYNWTVHDYNLPTNNRLYVSGSSLDQQGLQLVITTASGSGYAMQLSAWYDPASAETEFRETQQYFYSYGITGFRNLVGTFSRQDYNGGAMPTCNPPARPANTVTPASVARIICPNLERSISDTYGDADVGNFAVHADGTLIQSSRVYTQQFTAEGSGTVRQLAVGILRNIDQPDTILVRMGLYAAANNSLIVQTAQLSLYQAIDQLIIMNLPFAVNLVAGQTYMIGLISSAPLEVATSAAATSPSMSVPFSSTGLPQTFTSSGSAVSVSVAAYVCVSTTHSICGTYQYYVPSTGNAVTLIYQGLLQVDSTPRTNAWGTYRQVLAAGGRLTAYQRGSESPTQTSTVYTFTQPPQSIGNLYVISTNNRWLDEVGLRLSISVGSFSSLVFNTSISRMDESWRGDDKETDLVYSTFSFVTLTDLHSPIPACSLQNMQHVVPDPVPLPTCEVNQNLVWYGDADNADSSYNQEGYYIGEANHLYLRPITTNMGKATIMKQIKFGININYNTVNYIRMGLYDKDFKFMAGTADIRMVNPHDELFTGTLTEPQILRPNTKYYLALWTQHAIYSGFSSGDAPAMIVPFGDAWPKTFINTVPNSQRAVGGVGCTTDQLPPELPSGSQSSSSSSSSSLSKGDVAGVVIGVVIATNLMLLCLFWFCCVGAASAKHVGNEIDSNSEQSRIS